jgi:hypothetical protein
LHNTKLAPGAENNPENNFLMICVCGLNVRVYSIFGGFVHGIGTKNKKTNFLGYYYLKLRALRRYPIVHWPMG